MPEPTGVACLLLSRRRWDALILLVLIKIYFFVSLGAKKEKIRYPNLLCKIDKHGQKSADQRWTVGGQSIIFFQNFTTSCSIDLPMMLSILRGRGWVECAGMGWERSRNRNGTNRGFSSYFNFRKNLQHWVTLHVDSRHRKNMNNKKYKWRVPWTKREIGVREESERRVKEAGWNKVCILAVHPTFGLLVQHPDLKSSCCLV